MLKNHKILAAPRLNTKVNKAKPNTTNVKPKNTTPRFPRLSDPTKEDILYDLYSPLIDSFYGIADIPSYVAIYLRSYLSTKAFSTTFYGNPNAFNLGKKDPEQHFYDAHVEAYDTIGKQNFENRLLIQDNMVQVFLKPLEIPLSFSVGADHKENMAIVEKTMRQLFPNFTMPQIFEKDQTSRFKANLVMAQPKYDTGWQSFSFYEKLKSFDTVSSDKYVPEEFQSFDEVEKPVRDALSIEVTLTELSTSDVNFHDAPTDRGSLSSLNKAVVNGTLLLTGRISIPMEAALWLTHATVMEEFVPKFLFDYLAHNMQVQVALAGETKVRAMPLEKVKGINDQIMKDTGYTPKPRLNAEGYCIDDNANILFIPTLENPAEYSKILRESYNPANGEIIPTAKLNQLHNIPLYSDWLNEVFVYTQTDGSLHTISLSGAIALDDVTLASYLNKPFNDLFGDVDPSSKSYSSSDAASRKNVLTFGHNLCQEFDLYRNMPQDDYVMRNYEHLYRYIENALGADNARKVLAFDFKTEELPTDKNLPKYVQALVELSRGISDKLVDGKSKYSVHTIVNIRFWYTLIGFYSQQGTKYKDALYQSLEDNALVDRGSVIKDLSVVNLPGLNSLLPHQAAVASQSLKHPKLLVLSIAPGGGKTIQGIVDSMLLKMAGKVKRIAIICPGILVKEWVSEINNVSKGAINAIPISATTVDKMVEVMGYTRAKFVSYIKSAPENSICVIDMNFLRLPRDAFNAANNKQVVQYGPLVIRQYPNTLLCRQLDFDYILVDESQRGKNSSSQTSEVIKSITANATYRRIASGTLIHNVPADLVAQMGMLNPSTLGNLDDFKRKYGELDDKGNLIGLRADAGVEMSKNIQVHATMVNKRRSEWAFLLPRVNTQFYNIDMTRNQQQFHEDLLDEALDKIKADKKLQELLKEGDPAKEALVESKLQKHLSPIEIFVNAPGENEAFANLSTTNEDDLVSAKIKMCEEIVEAHFTGGNVEGIKFTREKSAIIIFVYHKAALDNFEKHFKCKYPTLFYRAGDDATILKFRTDDKYKVLVAAETALREGLNLQKASRVVRTQTLWTPGNMEQAISRVLRPDVNDAYKREEINVDWLITNNTLEIAKTARVISKIVANSRVSEANNGNFIRFLKDTNIPNLKIMRMNLDAIREFRTHRDLSEYYNAYAHIQKWDEHEFKDNIQMLKTKVALKLGYSASEWNKITDQQVKKEAMIPVESKTQLPNSRAIFTILPNGARPLDHRDLNLKPLAAIKVPDANEDDQEEEIEDDNNLSVNVNDIVQTEFGYGKIVGLRKNSVKVVIPGFAPGGITLNKQVVFKPIKPDTQIAADAWTANVNKLKKEIKAAGTKGITFIEGHPAAKAVIGRDPTAKVVPLNKTNKVVRVMPLDKKVAKEVEPEEDNTDEQIEQNKSDILPTQKRDVKAPGRVELNSGIFNGLPTLYVIADGEIEHDVIRETGGSIAWRSMPSFAYRHVKTLQGAQNLVKALQENFTVAASITDSILTMAKRLNHRSANAIIQRAPVVFDIKNFLNMNHTKPTNADGIRIYPMIINGELYVAAMISVQIKAIQKLRKLNIIGVGKTITHDPIILYAPLNVSRVMKAIRDVSSKFKTKGANDAVKFFMSSNAKNMLRKV